MGALVTGAAAGLVHDSLSSGQAVGVSGLAYVLAAYITHRIAAFIVVDNLLVRFLTVAAASAISTTVRLFFYKVLLIELPVLAGGRTVASDITIGLFANLFVSVLLYIFLDRIFKKDAALRTRRSEARRRRL